MARDRQRVCLQDGLKLDINRLARNGLIRRGAYASAHLRWTHSYWGEVAHGGITANMPTEDPGWITIELAGDNCQHIALVVRSRHFGGRQWYFRCPSTGRLASVLWRPPGARWFASRQAWGRQVAYQSQFQDAPGRAHLGQQRVKTRLIGSLDPDEWDLPPKPKWMRWKTYERHERKFDQYEETLDHGLAAAAAKLTGLKLF